MRRKPVAEININHERWLVSYADFITLLFAFFVVMYSISQVNESKYRVLSATLTKVFAESKRTLKPIQLGELSRSNQRQISQSNVLHHDANNMAELPQLSNQFITQFSGLINDKHIQIASNEYWLQISLSNSLLFSLGSVKLKKEARAILAEMADLLRGFNNPIQVEGYTDNIVVNSAQFPSNWELSTARALAAVKTLIDEGISPDRLAAVGYGEYQPIAENTSPEGRAQNRRVVLMIAREKIQRPRINTIKALEDKFDLPVIEKTQVNPQPGLDQKFGLDQSTLESKKLTPEEKMNRLIDSNLIDSNLGIRLDSVFKRGDMPLVNNNNSNDSSNGNGNANKNNKAYDNKVTPVKTKSGGLLFSSDPDLPRNRN